MVLSRHFLQFAVNNFVKTETKFKMIVKNIIFFKYPLFPQYKYLVANAQRKLLDIYLQIFSLFENFFVCPFTYVHTVSLSFSKAGKAAPPPPAHPLPTG